MNLGSRGILDRLFPYFLVGEKKRVDSNISNDGNIVKLVRIRNLKIENEVEDDYVEMEITDYRIKDTENVRVGVSDI